jgi:exosortase
MAGLQEGGMGKGVTHDGYMGVGLFRHPLWLVVAGYWVWLIVACARDWTEVADYQHGWFVPFFAAYFLWKRVERTKGRRDEGTKGRRDEGTKGPQDDRTTGPLDGGTTGLKDEGTKGLKDQEPETGTEAQRKWPKENLKSEGGGQRGAGGEDLRLTNLKLKTAPQGLQWLAWLVIGVSLLVIFPLEVVRQAPLHWRLYPWMIGLLAAGNTLAVAWLTGGPAAWRVVMVPTLFMLVGIPWPTAVENLVSLPLMGWVTQWSVGLLHVLGYPATAAGNVITLPNCTVGVEEACSGLRSLQTALLVGVAAGELARLGVWGRVVLLAAGFVMALVANQVRVMMLALAGISGGNEAVTNIHDAAGYAVLGVLLGGMAALTWVVVKLERAVAGTGRTL